MLSVSLVQYLYKTGLSTSQKKTRESLQIKSKLFQLATNYFDAGYEIVRDMKLFMIFQQPEELEIKDVLFCLKALFLLFGGESIGPRCSPSCI